VTLYEVKITWVAYVRFVFAACRVNHWRAFRVC
jgi:hypothetical protein